MPDDGKVLIDDFDSAEPCFMRRAEIDQLAIQMNFPGCRLNRTAEDLHKRGFPGAIVTDDADGLALVEIEIHPAQGRNLSITLLDVAHLDDGSSIGGSVFHCVLPAHLMMPIFERSSATRIARMSTTPLIHICTSLV